MEAALPQQTEGIARETRPGSTRSSERREGSEVAENVRDDSEGREPRRNLRSLLPAERRRRRRRWRVGSGRETATVKWRGEREMDDS